MHSLGTYSVPVSSFVFHSSLLTVNSVNLVVARDGFLFILRNRPYFSLWLLLLQRCFSNTSWLVLLRNELNITDREGKWIPQSQTITGAYGTIVIFIVAALITFWMVLDSYCCVTGWTKQTKNGNGYFALRHNWGARNHYYLMMWNAWVHQSVNIINLQNKLTN